MTSSGSPFRTATASCAMPPPNRRPRLSRTTPPRNLSRSPALKAASSGSSAASRSAPTILASTGFSVPVTLANADDVNRVLRAGAVAAQLGTAFLLADEAGSSPVHRAALQDPQFTETVVTKAFSGRYARGLRNRFIDEHEAQAPLGYPEIHYLTSPLRAASVRTGDPHAVNVWAGTGFRSAKAAPVADIMKDLT